MTGRNERVVWAIFWAGFKGDPAVELYLNTFLVHFFPVKTTKLACFYIKNWEGEEEDFTDMMLPRSECERHCDLWELVCMRSSVTSRVITVTCAITAHPPAESATPTGGWTDYIYILQQQREGVPDHCSLFDTHHGVQNLHRQIDYTGYRRMVFMPSTIESRMNYYYYWSHRVEIISYRIFRLCYFP